MEEKELQTEGESSQPEPEHATGGIPEAAVEDPAEAPGEVAGDEPAVSVDELLAPSGEAAEAAPLQEGEADLRAILEAVVYIAEEPLTVPQMAAALGRPSEVIQSALNDLIAEFEKPEHGIAIREVAGGYKIATKAEH